MIESNQFGSQTPHTGTDAKLCAQYEAMLADVVDGLLTPEDLVTFEEHATGCVGCGVHLAEARHGAALLSVLKAHPPEPNAALVTRILAQTSVRTAAEQETLRSEQQANAEQVSLLGSAPRGSSLRKPASAPADVAVTPGVLPFHTRLGLRLRPVTHTVLQPRFMMTAAMAFFSIALTLNVAGIRLNEIHASDLKPASLRRSFYQANAHVVRYYDNLRVVYELESRVHDLQHSAEENNPATTYPSTPTGGTPEPKQKGDAPGAATPKSGEPARKNPDGATSRPDPNPKSGRTRREYPAQPPMQVAFGRQQLPLNASALLAPSAWNTQTSFGRAL